MECHIISLHILCNKFNARKIFVSYFTDKQNDLITCLMNKVPLIQKVYLLTDTDLINNIETVYHKRYLYKTSCHINLLVYPSEDFLDVEKDKG